MTPNRLIHEQSPYLRQHAHNPVDWYPWGEEAFQKARTEEKPIFLSIGYSTCHWCHVMERESFEDVSIAQYLGEHFVSIKVDREERPDLDHIYMAAVQAMSGSGGWPMTLFLTPELKPFFGGTYFPPVSAYGRPSFRQLLERVHALWDSERVSLISSGDTLTRAIQQKDRLKISEPIEIKGWPEISDLALEYFEQTFDAGEGGFGSAPKFPRPVQFDFLFNHFYKTGVVRAKEIALFTLRKMALGGIRDHLSGGFHRYSVDRYWRISHFEKMLYDQAQLINSYLDAFQITQDSFFSNIAEEIVAYVLRDMTHKDGGFFSAEDADSEGREGAFYVWTKAEIERELGIDNASIFCQYFGITTEGNFEDGKNVLYVATAIEELARSTGQTSEEVAEVIGRAKMLLTSIRSKQVRPNLDDKILTSWNGLMIGALARAGDILGREEILDTAKRAGNFIWSELREKPGMLLHRWRDGDARFPAYLEDFAFLIQGYLALYRSTLDLIWLDRAIQLQEEQNRILFDAEDGGYYRNRKAPDILHQSKDDYDGAEPSGNSISVTNLVALARATGKKEYYAAAEQTLDLYHRRLEQHPYAMPELVVGAGRMEESGMQIALAGESELFHEFQATIADYFLPDVIIIHTGDTSILDPFYRALPAVAQKPTAYLCKNFACELPVTSATDLRVLIEKAMLRPQKSE